MPSYGTTPLLDDFNRANETLNATGATGLWSSKTAPGRTLHLVSNAATGELAGSTAVSGWGTGTGNPGLFAADQECYCTVKTLPGATQFLRFYARLAHYSSTNETGYMCQWLPGAAAGSLTIHKETARETFTQIGTAAVGFAVNDVIGLSCVGNQIVAFKNGAAVLTVTDATFNAAGFTALGARDTVARLDDWSGGSIVTSAIKTVEGIAYASSPQVKTVQGVAQASIKTILGLA